MIHVDCDGDLGFLCGLSGGMQEQAVGVLDRPWEELQDDGRVLRFGCSYTGDDALDVVETHGWNGIATCRGGVNNGLRSVVCGFGHGCDVAVWVLKQVGDVDEE